MTESSTQSIVIAAPPERVAAVITDFTSYPEWVSAVKSAEVIEEYEDGYASQVSFSMDAGVFKDSYTLRYGYTEDFSQIEWSLTEPSQVQKLQQGAYQIDPNDDGGCTVTYTLSVEPNIPMLGMFKRKAEKMIMDAALKDLKKRVESLA
ncbi:MAG: SRPBCC family protein [Micromonosporaceae bacterium]